MPLITLDCPKCGAAVPHKDPGAQNVTCDYCGTSFGLESARSARDETGVIIDAEALAQIIARHQKGHPQLQLNLPGTEPRASSGGSALGCLITIVAIIAGAIPLWLSLGEMDVDTDIDFSKVVAKVKIERSGWDDAGGPPVPARVNKKRAVLGRTRYYDEDHALYIEAFKASDASRLWRFGPLGSYSEGYRSTWFAVLGDRVVVTENDAKVHLVNLNTGKKLKTRELTDKAQGLCIPPDKKGNTVWVMVADKRHQAINIKSGKLKEATLPEFCNEPGIKTTIAARARQREELARAPDLKGFKALRVHISGHTMVVAGHKHPGTAIPRAAGFNADSDKLLWQKELAMTNRSSVREAFNFDALVKGRYVAVYGTGQDTWHVTALDAKTGDRIWDTKLRPLFAVDSIDDLVVTDRHAFIVRTSSMEIFDVRKGKLLGTAGSETYD